MATAFERFRIKWMLTRDAVQRIGDEALLTPESVARDLTYLEGQLSRVIVNAQRALNYLSEIEEVEEPETAADMLAADQAAAELSDIEGAEIILLPAIEDLAAELQAEDELKRKGKEGTNGKHHNDKKEGSA